MSPDLHDDPEISACLRKKLQINDPDIFISHDYVNVLMFVMSGSIWRDAMAERAGRSGPDGDEDFVRQHLHAHIPYMRAYRTYIDDVLAGLNTERMETQQQPVPLDAVINDRSAAAISQLDKIVNGIKQEWRPDPRDIDMERLNILFFQFTHTIYGDNNSLATFKEFFSFENDNPETDLPLRPLPIQGILTSERSPSG